MSTRTAPTSRLVASITNYCPARRIAAALGFFCLTAAIALPPTAAHAQTVSSDEAAKVPVPTVVLHLSAENAAPTRAVLHERILTGLSIHGPILAPKAGESHIIRFSPTTNDAAATTKALEELGKKHAATHPPLRVPNQNDVEKQKADDAALLAAVAQKSKSGKGFMDFAAITKNMPSASPLSVSLTPQQPTDPTGRVSLLFIAPLGYNPAGNLVLFQNTKPFVQKVKIAPGLFSPTEIIYTPSSYLSVAIKMQKGKMYLVVAKASWGTFPFNVTADAINDFNAIRVSSSPVLNDSTETMIPGGTASTSLVLQGEKDGWYDLTFAGLANEWAFKGITIKEIAP